MSEATPTLAQVIKGAIQAAQRGVYVSLPGRVESYDSATQTCSVQPLILNASDDEFGDRVTERLPVISSVPVVFPGAGSYSITWPLNPGDVVLLIFSSGSLDRWIELGGEVDPIDDRRQSINDAVAIAGLRPKPGALGSEAVADALVVSAAEIRLGSSSAGQAAVKGNAYRSAEDTLFTKLAAFCAAVAAIPALSAALSATATALATEFSTFAAGATTYLASKVKVE